MVRVIWPNFKIWHPHYTFWTFQIMYVNRVCQRLCQWMKNLPVKGMVWVTWPILKFWDPLYNFGAVKDRNLLFGTHMDHKHRPQHDKLSPKAGVVRITWPNYLASACRARRDAVHKRSTSCWPVSVHHTRVLYPNGKILSNFFIGHAIIVVFLSPSAITQSQWNPLSGITKYTGKTAIFDWNRHLSQWYEMGPRLLLNVNRKS